MASRSYLLVRLDGSLDRDGVVRLVRQLEELDEVNFSEPVVGAFDLVVTAESSDPVESLVQKVESMPGVCEVVCLRATAIPWRERMWRNLTQIPLTRQE
ncbi:MAG: hypothetical protein ACYC5O_10900 [Anaerolineae bacterium]